jgi:Ca-activated chloride channel family protein
VCGRIGTRGVIELEPGGSRMNGSLSLPVALILCLLCGTPASSQKERKPDRQDPAQPSVHERSSSPARDAGRQEKESKTAPDHPAPQARSTDDKIRLEAKLVSISVSVADRFGRFVTGLSKDDFEVVDDGVKQEIAVFADEDAPVSMGIVYDVSGSMKDLTNRSFAALRRFFETSHEDDEFFVIAFNRKPQLVHDFTPSPNEILNRVVFIKAKGMTALYDATYLAVEKARQGRHPKKALLIISDGQENSSRYSGPELRRLLEEAEVQIYAVGEGSLGWMADLTGGRAYSTWEFDKMRDIYTQIAVFLRRQYVIGFYPTDSGSAQREHNVRIQIKAPKGLGRLHLSYKKSYRSFR